MQDFLLPIFPQGALSGSVITTVWIGVAVVVFFNLRFGWVLTGLVVPGYLVPLLLIKPWSVAVIFVESAVTYWLAWLFSEYISRTGLWSSLFGRDRFFAIVLFRTSPAFSFRTIRLLEVELRQHLRATLPVYAMPARISVMSGLPRTSTGKLDRRQLVANLGASAV